MTLLERYRGYLLDLDGVLFRGAEPIAGSAEALERIRAAGGSPVFLTNNSSRTPQQVAEKLRGLGFSAHADEVVTSALALGEAVAQLAGDGERPTAFVIGEDGVRRALAERGVRMLDGDPERADLVVVGWDRRVDYARLRTASLLVQRGARLLATNDDASYPAPDGLWPGAGAILAVITTTTRAVPTVFGKPHPGLLRTAARRAGAEPLLVVGDRLETDVAAAVTMGWDSALVLSGAATPRDLVRSPWQPTYLLDSLAHVDDAGPPRVREAARGDRAAVEALLQDAGLSAAEAGEGRGTTLVAETEDGGVVGTGAIELHGDDGLLRSLAVAEHRRGARTGTLLAAALVRRAADAGARAVYLLTETAEAFFGSLGFEPIARDAVPEPVAATPAVTACAVDRARAMRIALE